MKGEDVTRIRLIELYARRDCLRSATGICVSVESRNMLKMELACTKAAITALRKLI